MSDATLRQREPGTSWVAVAGLGLAAFIFVTSEFIPVGLLPEIARGFQKTDAEAGGLMTIYAWIVAAMSIPLTALASRHDRRPLMLTLLGLFFVATLLTAGAANFPLLIVARMLVAFTHAVFWAVVTPLGIRLAPRSQRERALSMIATGSTLGSILGIPLGTYIGQLFGWRVSFLAIAVGAALTGLVLMRVLPRVASQGAGGMGTFLKLLKRRDLSLTYLFIAVMMTGQFTAFTFITPFLIKGAGYAPEKVATVLLAYGCAGVAGSFLAPAFIRKYFRASALISIAVVALSLLLLRPAARLGFAPTLLLVFVWGAMFLIVNIVLQNLVLLLAPDAEDIAMAGGSGIYNIGIGGGALFGSLLSSADALSRVGEVGAALVAVAWILCAVVVFSRHQPPARV